MHTLSVQAVFIAMTLCTLVMCLKKQFWQRLVLVLSTQYHTHPGCTQTPIEINFQSTLQTYTHVTLFTMYQLKPVSNVLTLCTLVLCLKKYFCLGLVLVLSTQYHTHPGSTHTPIEINFQSTLTNIHPCNSIHKVSIEACFQCIDVMHVISVSEKIVLAKTCSCSFYPVSYAPWVYSNTNRNVLSINTL